MSLVEQKRQEAFVAVCEQLDERLQKEMGATFESHGREYQLTSAEDCMVANAQLMLEEVSQLHDEIIAKADYREEQSVAKLHELFATYERLITLYAELRSYYPRAAGRAESYLPPLSESARRGEILWEQVQAKQQ